MKTKRVFIGIFGRRNKGKSSLINALAGQEIAIVSEMAGTTTDPVKKTIEIFGIGPTVLIDTAGIDDTGSIGKKRIQKTNETLKIIDVAILLIADNQFSTDEENLIERFSEYNIPYLIVHNKSDIIALNSELRTRLSAYHVPVLECSATNQQGVTAILDALVAITPTSAYIQDTLVGDLVVEGESVVLVMPQDAEAPEGRLILPQVQVIRDILDQHAVAIALQPEELSAFLKNFTPKMVITDSQAFATIAPCVPEHIPLTSFSIVLSRAKGNFEAYLKGTPHINELKDNDKILMLESCTHVTACEDIGRHKIPQLMQKVTGKKLIFDFVSALQPLPENLQQYAMAIQCGGCMVTQKQLQNRVNQIIRSGVPISNYGMTLACLTGIFKRATQLFTD